MNEYLAAVILLILYAIGLYAAYKAGYYWEKSREKNRGVHEKK